MDHNVPRIAEEYAVVVAHPDDEVLWFGSVLANAKKVIVVFGDCDTQPLLGPGRRAVMAEYPCRNVTFLDIPESSAADPADWEDPHHAAAGIAIGDTRARARYENTYARVVMQLEPLLRDVTTVFTHNPWGEYGHEDHVQVYQAVRAALAHKKGKIWVSSHSADKSTRLMQKTASLIGHETLSALVDRDFALSLKRLYQKYDCWTWKDDWQPPAEESFQLGAWTPQSMQTMAGQVADIFHVLILDDGKTPNPIHPVLEQNIHSFTSAYPNASHHLLNGNDARDFIKAHFEPAVCDAYDKLQPHAYKADLARYCLLYVKGGLYVDAGIRLYGPLLIPATKRIAFFRDVTRSSSTSWAVSNGLLYAQPACEEFKVAIDVIVQNCRQNNYGDSPLSPTGPALLGRVFAMQGHSADYLCGEVRLLTPDCPEKNVGFIDHDGNIIALRKKPLGESYLGLAGANDYSALWKRRRVYGEFEMSWSHSDKEIHCNEEMRTKHGIQVNVDNLNYQLYGPYITLEGGRYKAALKFAADSIFETPYIDVCSDVGAKIHATFEDDSMRVNADGEIAIIFELEKYCREVEIRLHSKGKFSGLFLGLSLSPVFE